MIEATVNIQPILSKFDRMKRRDQRRVFSQARRPVRQDIRDHARSQASPDGKWPERASSTKERRGNRKRLLGRLPGAFTITTGADFVRAVWRVGWSGVMKRGGRVGHGSKVPPRDFAWISRKLKREIRDLLKAAVYAAWKR